MRWLQKFRAWLVADLVSEIGLARSIEREALAREHEALGRLADALGDLHRAHTEIDRLHRAVNELKDRLRVRA
jgi:hypothetical protein